MPSHPPPPPRLLRADEAQLDRAARVLADGSVFLIIIAPPALRPVALAHLRQRLTALTVPETILSLDSAQASLDALTEQSHLQERLLSIQLGADPTGALEGLNWHREKLLQGGPVVLWLDEEQMKAVREVAPDAYSFRTSLQHLHGGRPILPLGAPGPEEVHRLRRRLERARNPLERAQVSSRLAQALRLQEHLDEAMAISQTALDSLSDSNDESHLLARSRLEHQIASTWRHQRKLAASYRQFRRLLAALEDLPLSPDGVGRRIAVLSDVPGAFIRDLTCSGEGLELISRFEADPTSVCLAIIGAVQTRIRVGDIRPAQSLLDGGVRLESLISPYNQGLLQGLIALRARALGDIDAAILACEARLRKSAQSGPAISSLMSLLFCWLMRGELEQVDLLVEEYWDEFARHGHPEIIVCTAASLWRDELPSAISALTMRMKNAIAQERDGELNELSELLTHLLTDAHSAERMDLSIHEQARDTLLQATTTALRIAGTDGPPWYAARYLGWQAALLALDPSTLDEAIATGQRALDHARQDYPDLHPTTACIQADALLRAGRHAEALALVIQVEPEAVSRGLLRDRARLIALRLRARVAADEPASIAHDLAQLREAMEAMDAPRLTAETLLELVRRLPPGTDQLDVAGLAGEAQRLFESFPMPAQASHAQEIMGDALAAHGRHDEARRRYQAARRRLEQHGLLLRVPLIDRKLAALPSGEAQDLRRSLRQ